MPGRVGGTVGSGGCLWGIGGGTVFFVFVFFLFSGPKCPPSLVPPGRLSLSLSICVSVSLSLSLSWSSVFLSLSLSMSLPAAHAGSCARSPHVDTGR